MLFTALQTQLAIRKENLSWSIFSLYVGFQPPYSSYFLLFAMPWGITRTWLHPIGKIVHGNAGSNMALNPDSQNAARFARRLALRSAS